MREKLISDFMASIYERFSVDDLKYIQNQLAYNLDMYELTERCTDVALIEAVPSAVKAYLVSQKNRRISGRNS